MRSEYWSLVNLSIEFAQTPWIKKSNKKSPEKFLNIPGLLSQ